MGGNTGGPNIRNSSRRCTAGRLTRTLTQLHTHTSHTLYKSDALYLSAMKCVLVLHKLECGGLMLMAFRGVFIPP